MTVPTSPVPKPDLAWLAGILWPGDGDTPGGGRYLAVPARRPRFIVGPIGPGSLAGPLRSFNGMRPPRVRAARVALAAAVAVTGGRLVGTSFSAPAASPGEVGLLEVLSAVLGRDDLVLGIGVPRSGPNRKPVVQVHAHDGTAIAFAKVGWNDITSARVAVEGAALARLATIPALGVPELVHLGTWQGRTLLVTAPLPATARRASSQVPPVELVRQVVAAGEAGIVTLGTSPQRADLTARIQSLPDGAESDALRRLIALVDADDGGVELAVGGRHGDWVPWNLARSGRQWHAFDWEHWEIAGFAGWDVVHHAAHVAMMLQDTPFGVAVTEAAAASTGALDSFGVSDAARRAALLRLYVAELGTRTAAAVAAGAPATGPVWRGMLDAVAAVSRPTKEVRP